MKKLFFTILIMLLVLMVFVASMIYLHNINTYILIAIIAVELCVFLVLGAWTLTQVASLSTPISSPKANYKSYILHVTESIDLIESLIDLKYKEYSINRFNANQLRFFQRVSMDDSLLSNIFVAEGTFNLQSYRKPEDFDRLFSTATEITKAPWRKIKYKANILICILEDLDSYASVNVLENSILMGNTFFLPIIVDICDSKCLHTDISEDFIQMPGILKKEIQAILNIIEKHT